MDITTLKQIIETALQSQPFTISGAQLESPDITKMLTGVYGSDTFVLTGATKQSESADNIIVAGTSAQTLIGQPTLPAQATFYISGTTAEMHVLFTPVPSTWKPSVSFTSLQNSVFDQFNWASSSLTLDSINPPALPSGYPVNYDFPAYSQEMIDAEVQALAVQSTLSASTGSSVMDWLLSGANWQVTGPIVLPATQISINVASQPTSGLSIGGFTFPFSISVASAVAKYPEQDAVIATLFQLDAQVVRQLSSSTFRFPVFIRQTSTTATTMTIKSAPIADSPITFNQVGELIGATVAEMTQQQPPPSLDFPLFDQIQLSDVEMILNTSPASMVSLAGTITWIAPTSFSAFNGLFVFNSMAVTFTYLPDGYPRDDGSVWYVQTDIAATCTVSGGVLVATLGLPDVTFTCELQEGTAINISDLVLAAVGNSITMPRIDCTELSIYGDVSGGEYRFSATVASDWTFNIGSTPFSLTEIDMDITKDSSGFSGQLAAKFSIAGVDLYGRAAYDPVSAGWEFQMGTVEDAHVSITDFINSIFSYFGVQLPATAPQLYLNTINFSFNTATHAWTFQAQSTLEIAASTTIFGVEMSNNLYKGYLWVGESYFEVDFATDQKVTMTALWRATTEQAYLTFEDIASMLGLPAPAIPDGLDLNLMSASMTYGFSDGLFVVTAQSQNYGKAVFIAEPVDQKTVYYFALATDHPIEISNLPVLHTILGPEETAAIDKLQVITSSGDITADQATAINNDIPEGYPKLPATGMKSPVGLSAEITFGGTKIPISLGMSNVDDKGGQSTAGNSIVGPQSGTNPGSVTSTPPAQSDGTMWFNIQKTFGPVTFDKIGIRYSDSVLWIALNASLKISGLTITLIGASIGSPITSFSPRFALQGLGIDFKNPPLEIGGGFIKVTPENGDIETEYDGSVVVKMPQFSLTAYGSYIELKSGNPSMFLFAQVSGKFGGPPIFFVTGILGGFGYNSQVRLPSQTEIFEFPFVAGIGDPSKIGGANATPVEALQTITGGDNPWVYPSLGQNWITAGLTFTSYELVNSVAELMVQFGKELSISLMGLSTATFPPGGVVSRPYAQVQLQLLAQVLPAQGFFGISANLTRNSYLLDPSCVLQGGFAFYFWYTPSDPAATNRAGDFVVTLGGYNSNFDKPDWYPDEPRLGFSWSYDSSISINGGAYFALTPSTIQAGGSLGLNFHDGALRAWFTAHADLIVWFKPFYFILEIGVSVGASYTQDLLFTSVTLTIELGADLTLWGPPTSGKADIHWWVISFTVHFGPTNEPTRPQPVPTWTDFASLLPPAKDVVKITALTGLAAQQVPNQSSVSRSASRTAAVGEDAAATPWVVRNNNFSMVTRSAIPLKSLTFGSHTASGSDLNVRPMQQSGSASNVVIIKLNGVEIPYADWSAEPQTVGVAKALWGEGDGSHLDAGNEQLVADQLTGFVIYGPPPSLGYTAGAIPVEQNLGFDPLSPNGIIAVVSGGQPQGDIPVDDQNTIEIIETQIATTAVPPRTDLYNTLAALGVDAGANGTLTNFAQYAGRLFTAQPMIVPAA